MCKEKISDSMLLSFQKNRNFKRGLFEEIKFAYLTPWKNTKIDIVSLHPQKRRKKAILLLQTSKFSFNKLLDHEHELKIYGHATQGILIKMRTIGQ